MLMFAAGVGATALYQKYNKEITMTLNKAKNEAQNKINQMTE